MREKPRDWRARMTPNGPHRDDGSRQQHGEGGMCPPEHTFTQTRELKMDNISAILAQPANYGFMFQYEPVATDEGETDLGKAPKLVVTDVALFEKSFPGRILAMLDGSSAAVISQRVTRASLKANRLPESERKALEPKVLNAILGVKSRAPVIVEKKVYALPDGSTTDDLAAFKQAWGIEG